MKWTKLNFTEPAVLRGIVAAVVALAAAIGFVLPVDLPGLAEVLIPVVSFVVPLVQAWSTRQAVDSPQTVERKVAAASDGFPIDEPGDHAAREV